MRNAYRAIRLGPILFAIDPEIAHHFGANRAAGSTQMSIFALRGLDVFSTIAKPEGRFSG